MILKLYIKTATIYGSFLKTAISRTVYKTEDDKCIVKIEGKNYEVVRENGVWKVIKEIS